MKSFLTLVNTTLLCAALTLAQSTPTSSTASRSWTGLLVAAGCPSSGTSADMRSTAPASSGVTENGMAKTTPGMNREPNTTYEQTQNQADRNSAADRTDVRKSAPATLGTSDMRNSTPETANNNSSTMALKNEDAWMTAEKVAGKMDKSCHISTRTSSFALRLPDGRIVPFDDASNAKIASQLRSTNRLGNKAKILRVVVTGAMQSDRISMEYLKL